ARGLQGALDDVPEAVNPPGAETAAKGVERQFAVEFDTAVLDKIECFALGAEAIGFKPVDQRGREPVIDLRDIDMLEIEPRTFPGQFRRAAAALHVVGEAADAARDLEMQPLSVAG